MLKFAVLPLIVFTLSALLTWAMGRYRELGRAQRAAALTRPRSRPYGTDLPEALRRG